VAVGSIGRGRGPRWVRTGLISEKSSTSSNDDDRAVAMLRTARAVSRGSTSLVAEANAKVDCSPHESVERPQRLGLGQWARRMSGIRSDRTVDNRRWVPVGRLSEQGVALVRIDGPSSTNALVNRRSMTGSRRTDRTREPAASTARPRSEGAGRGKSEPGAVCAPSTSRPRTESPAMPSARTWWKTRTSAARPPVTPASSSTQRTDYDPQDLRPVTYRSLIVLSLFNGLSRWEAVSA
jgi:hypothetical protein